MKKEELRIGNYVISKMCGQIKVQFIPVDIDMENYEAIPLTEEWLIKLGYKNAESYIISYRLFYINDGNFDGDFIVRFYRDDIDVAPFSKIPVHGRDQFLSISIQYVHQLQNLYFALTGEELTLKV